MTEELGIDGTIDGKHPMTPPDAAAAKGTSKAAARQRAAAAGPVSSGSKRNAALRAKRTDLGYLSEGISDSVNDEPDDSTEPVRIEIMRGSYVGLGCPDPDDRLFTRDLGSGYTHDHPARCVHEDYVAERDQNSGADIIKQRFVHGEIVQLFPIPKQEEEAANEMKAKAKRHTFSRREAVKKADQMIAGGTARYV